MKSPIKWFRNLSTAGKTAVIIVGLTAAGAAASPNSATPTNTNSQQPKVEAARSAMTTENVSVSEDVPYQKETREDSSMPLGTSKVTTLGVNGTKTIIYKVTKKDGVEVNRELVSELVTTEPVNEITTKGTYVAPAEPAPAPRTSSSCNPNYSPCIPNSPYDLDCADIGFTVRVIGYDVYRLDRDKDGYGCE